MAINLNLPKYGDQFKVFVDFAKANENNLDALACIDDGAQGEPNVIKEKESLVLDGKLRSIVAKTDDDKITSAHLGQHLDVPQPEEPAVEEEPAIKEEQDDEEKMPRIDQ